MDLLQSIDKLFLPARLGCLLLCLSATMFTGRVEGHFEDFKKSDSFDIESQKNNPFFSGQTEAERNLALGLCLVNNFWGLVEEQDIRGYSNKLSIIYQVESASGIGTRSEQIAGLSGLTVTSFLINTPVVTRLGDVLVISYDFVATGEGIVSGPSLDVWKKGKNHSGWKLISHTYFPAPV